MSKESEILVQRRNRIVIAARKVFLERGHRATTMEAIAKAAGIAKPTLYGYFPDKDAVFKSVVSTIVEEMKAAFLENLPSEGTPSERIFHALACKFLVMHKVFHGSPHKAELLSEEGRLSADDIHSFKKWLHKQVEDILEDAGYEEPEFITKIMLASIMGVHLEEFDPPTFARGAQLIIHKLLH
ncbi:TetR/AcrR family transcriptional regulator [Hirschia litorea]|uniref:TetR/AcrR family transcriptional regulator n=1 Tax=Hirschia litorea TaxID=1199156 RepID=A0ABW2IKB4_9PROT